MIQDRGGKVLAKTLSFKTRLTMRADGRNDPHHGFGKGIEMLLLGVDKYGSLNRAAKEMGMAYSKAWNVLRLNESEFGIKFINRNGAHGSELTPEGRAFLEHYQEMELAAERAAQEVFDKYFR